ncbi:hypothetical protein ACFWNL_35890 [Kitasatospora sp. NPDC058397]|uniref:hypothetical protein n=1 Tax=unclassified Kitasatospora TaxID=2633591 RepID=UPI00366929FA
MTSTNPDTVPATPVYTITLTSYGTAQVDSEEIPVPEGGDARLAALGEVRIKAALHGRPVRVTAKEADGSSWPLVVAVDGSVTTLDRPHPAPAPATPAAAATTAHPTAVVPAYTQPPAAPGAPFAGQPLPPPAHTPPVPPSGLPERQEVPATARPSTLSAPPPAAPQTATEPADWTAPFPEPYMPLLDRLRRQDAAGDIDGAHTTAGTIEAAFAAVYGLHHPHTLNMTGLRVWLMLRRGTDWAETTEALLDAVDRRRQAGAPEADTHRLVRDAHTAWRKLIGEDPEYALEVATTLVELLVILGPEGEKRAKSVIGWIESGVARRP